MKTITFNGNKYILQDTIEYKSKKIYQLYRLGSYTIYVTSGKEFSSLKDAKSHLNSGN